MRLAWLISDCFETTTITTVPAGKRKGKQKQKETENVIPALTLKPWSCISRRKNFILLAEFSRRLLVKMLPHDRKILRW